MYMRLRRLFWVVIALTLLANCGGSGGDDGDNGFDSPEEPGNADPVIAFLAAFPFRYGGIWVMDANGGNKTHVFGEEGIVVGSPSWSPDGRFLAFHTAGSALGCPDHPDPKLESSAFGLVEFNPNTKEWGEPTLLLCPTTLGTGELAFSPQQDGNRYTLAYASGGDFPFILDIYLLTFEVTDNGLVVNDPVNITQNPSVQHSGPKWSPLGDKIVAEIDVLRFNPDAPDDPTEAFSGLQDVAIFKADGSDIGSLGQSFLENIPELQEFGLGGPDWARTNADLLLFHAAPEGERNEVDIYCLEQSTGRVVNVTQIIDDQEGVEDNNSSPSWRPDDSGFVFLRREFPIFTQLVEMRFGDGYDPATGCPSERQLANASVVVLAQDEGGREQIWSPDYWRNAPRPPSQ